MTRIISDFRQLPILSFDERAATVYANLKSQRTQLATMDSRIAAIAVSR